MPQRSIPLPAKDDIEAWRLRLGLTNRDLWLGYFELGGNGSLVDLGLWLTGKVRLPPPDHDLLALALNEVFSERGLNHPVGYSDDPIEPSPA